MIAPGLWMIGVPSVLGIVLIIASSIYAAGKNAGMRKRQADATRAYEVGFLRGRQQERYDQTRDSIVTPMHVTGDFRGEWDRIHDEMENDGRGIL